MLRSVRAARASVGCADSAHAAFVRDHRCGYAALALQVQGSELAEAFNGSGWRRSSRSSSIDKRFAHCEFVAATPVCMASGRIGRALDWAAATGGSMYDLGCAYARWVLLLS